MNDFAEMLSKLGGDAPEPRTYGVRTLPDNLMDEYLTAFDAADRVDEDSPALTHAVHHALGWAVVVKAFPELALRRMGVEVDGLTATVQLLGHSDIVVPANVQLFPVGHPLMDQVMNIARSPTCGRRMCGRRTLLAVREHLQWQTPRLHVFNHQLVVAENTEALAEFRAAVAASSDEKLIN